MTKKVLMLAAKANMIQQFNHRNIKILQELGYEVHVATNMVDFGSMSYEENERFKQWMIDNEIFSHQVDFERRMGSVLGNMRSLKQLNNLFSTHDFVFVHVHSPLGSVLGRIIAKKFKVPVIYTVHGFHFFRGSSKKSWIMFYPLEWLLSFITNVMIAINDEDYNLAKRHMHAKNLVKINGIGVDVYKAQSVPEEYKQLARKRIREELKIPESAFLILSIGELSDRKNHKVVLDALRLMSPEDRNNIYYIIAGTGRNGIELKKIANSFKFSDNFELLGYRNDIHDINYASDVFIFPSLQEGLGVAGLEAVVDGTYLIGSNVRGIRDYVLNESIGTTFSPKDPNILATIINEKVKNNCKNNNIRDNDKLINFDKRKVDYEMKKIYE
ncbi:glycosyltransferase family 4 protein [Leuconostoc citreum]|uniref:glycosyltransferase n=1 Tax=Leuconostoc citreum TaxID=33964 RepID=UPI0011BBEC66|nr:glycosyltransferase [Leuconostoc citreum]QEA45931.1 glycosyltransferase family 4 protein [Leuconostoc citreum]QEA62620.1 glycosyltransferase family 4 protein [Leuconostoc citreum]